MPRTSIRNTPGYRPTKHDLFSLEGRVAVVTGGSGALGSTACAVLAGAGAVEQAHDIVLERHGRLDVLVNAAGGNLREATVEPGGTFFDLPPEAFDAVFRLNAQGTLLACQVFGQALARSGDQVTGRCIVNISSMAADRALTRVAGYGAAKAAVENLTRWLAVDLAHRFGDGLRVNAIAPGFVISAQNRGLLLDANEDLTDRGQAVVDLTPAGRLGRSADLVTTLLWLCSPESRFVTGVVVPVDGGFSAWSGI